MTSRRERRAADAARRREMGKRPRISHEAHARPRPAHAGMTLYGYVGFVYPERMIWNEYRIYEEGREEARDFLERVRATLPSATGAMAAELTSSAVLSSTPGIASEDEPLLGALSAILANRIEAGAIEANLVVNALSLLAGHRYFVITARKVDDGVRTTFEPLPDMLVATMAMLERIGPDEAASRIIQRREDVQAIKARLADALERLDPQTALRIERSLRGREDEARRDPRILLEALAEVDPGILRNVKH